MVARGPGLKFSHLNIHREPIPNKPYGNNITKYERNFKKR